MKLLKPVNFFMSTVVAMGLALTIGSATRASSSTPTQDDLDARLIRYVRNRHTDSVIEVLNQGANVDALFNDKTALMVAIERHGSLINNIPVITILLEWGANVNAQDDEGMTPLMIAAQRGHTDIESMLLAAGAEQ